MRATLREARRKPSCPPLPSASQPCSARQLKPAAHVHQPARRRRRRPARPAGAWLLPPGPAAGDRVRDRARHRDRPLGAWLGKPDAPVSIVALVGLAVLLFLSGLEIDVERLRGRIVKLTVLGFAASF